jgi:hypothetical protein
VASVEGSYIFGAVRFQESRDITAGLALYGIQAR